MEEVGILQDGNTQVAATHASAVAKLQNYKDGKSRYFIKIGPEGALYNPYGQHARGSLHLSSKRNGSPIWRYTEVNENCYKEYVAFLKHRNHRSLSYAERELRNG